MPVDYRYNPFADAAQPANITDEIHVIPAASPFAVKLAEVPVRDVPSSVRVRVVDWISAAVSSTTTTTVSVYHGAWHSIDEVITIDSEQMQVTDISANTLTVVRGYNSTVATTHTAGSFVYIEGSMTEVSATPALGQFWPDYTTGADEDPDWNTGTLLFNSADTGKIVAVNYKGSGTLVDNRIIPPPKYHPAYLDKGDGSGGDFISTGNVSLAGTYQYANFILNPGHTVTVGSYLMLRVKGVAIINGAIDARGRYAVSVATGGGSAGRGGNGAGTGAGNGADPNPVYLQYTTVGISGTPSAAVQEQLLKTGAILTGNKGGNGGSAGGGGAGGAGGNGGGFILIVADTIIVNGSLLAGGGNGAQAASGAAGGGGGGSGGVVLLVAYMSLLHNGTINVAGGTGGPKRDGASTAGANGSAGWYRLVNLST